MPLRQFLERDFSWPYLKFPLRRLHDRLARTKDLPLGKKDRASVSFNFENQRQLMLNIR